MINLALVPGADTDPSPRLLRALETLDTEFHIPASDVGVCIQSALIVRDFLRGLGFTAKVMPVGVVLEATENGELLHSLGIGMRAALDLPPSDRADAWDGHLVVLVEDGKRPPLLIDPAIGQARRDAWADLPSMLVVGTIAAGDRHKASGALARFLNEKRAAISSRSAGSPTPATRAGEVPREPTRPCGNPLSSSCSPRRAPRLD